MLYDRISITNDSEIDNRDYTSSEIINHYINKKDYVLAKTYALKHINEPFVCDLYIKVLELERISKNKQRKQILKKEC